MTALMKVPRKAISESPWASVLKRLRCLCFKASLHMKGPPRVARKTRFDTKAKGDSEMAY